MSSTFDEQFWDIDKKNLRKNSTVVSGSWRTTSPQRKTKRELRRQHLKQQRQVKPQPRGFGS